MSSRKRGDNCSRVINIKVHSHIMKFSPVFSPIKKWVSWQSLMMFTNDVKICTKDQRCRSQKRPKKRYV